GMSNSCAASYVPIGLRRTLCRPDLADSGAQLSSGEARSQRRDSASWLTKACGWTTQLLDFGPEGVSSVGRCRLGVAAIVALGLAASGAQPAYAWGQAHFRKAQAFYCYPRNYWWFYRPYTTAPLNYPRCMPYFHYLRPADTLRGSPDRVLSSRYIRIGRFFRPQPFVLRLAQCSATATAFETLRLASALSVEMRQRRSQCSRVSWRSPLPSAPSTSARGRVNGAFSRASLASSARATLQYTRSPS